MDAESAYASLGRRRSDVRTRSGATICECFFLIIYILFSTLSQLFQMGCIGPVVEDCLHWRARVLQQSSVQINLFEVSDSLFRHVHGSVVRVFLKLGNMVV